jgi:hypothetical protein
MQLGLDSYRPSAGPGVGGYHVPNGYKTLVNRYDNAANTPSLMGDWATRSAKWGTRVSLGRLADPHLSGDNPFVGRMKNALAPYAENVIGYQDLLGFDNNRIQRAPGRMWQATINNESKVYNNFWEAYQNQVSDNFKNFLRPEGVPGLTFREFMKKTVVGNNALELHHLLNIGRLGSFLSRLGGITLAGFEAVRKTIKAYQKDGVCSAGKTLVCESLKGGICWEVSTIGGGIGAGLACIIGLPGLAGGIVLGGLFGAITYRLLSKIIP